MMNGSKPKRTFTMMIFDYYYKEDQRQLRAYVREWLHTMTVSEAVQRLMVEENMTLKQAADLIGMLNDE